MAYEEDDIQGDRMTHALRLVIRYQTGETVRRLRVAVPAGATARAQDEVLSLTACAPEPDAAGVRALSAHVSLREGSRAGVTLISAVAELAVAWHGAQVETNGYQSWSQCEVVPALSRHRELIAPLRRTALGAYGDAHIAPRGGHNLPRSHEYICMHCPGHTILVGSVLGRECFTVLTLARHDGREVVRAHMDIEGVRLTSAEPSRQVLGLLQIQAPSRSHAFATFRGRDDIETVPPGRVAGWCSWYEYYADIDQEKLQAAISGLDSWPRPAVFQIDDGYQAAVGDWLMLRRDAFPAGLAPLARRARRSGLIPGLWLAPWVAAGGSQLVAQHPEWIARHPQSRRRIPAGWNQGWGGMFYGLNPLHPGLQDYLEQVFAVARDDWGFEYFKLDFLYAAALIPVGGLSRAQVMRRSMEFLRQAAGSALLLGCGVPLVSAAGLVDYCRVGADVAGRWETEYQVLAGSRERVSTHSSISSTLLRQWMDGHYFGNDPDVFLLRPWDNDLTEAERETLFLVNVLLGSQVFTSDDLGRYGPAQRRALSRMWPLPHVRVLAHDVDGEFHHVELEERGSRYTLDVNLGREPVCLPGSSIWLPGHHSRCERAALPGDPVITSDGYVLPGGEVLAVSCRAGTVTVKLRPGFLAPSRLQLRADVLGLTASPRRVTATGRSVESWTYRPGVVEIVLAAAPSQEEELVAAGA